jgi:hypothetical protein
MCAHVGNQWSRGVVIARLGSSVRSLLHQHRDLHLLTYLYLAENWGPTLITKQHLLVLIQVLGHNGHLLHHVEISTSK